MSQSTFEKTIELFDAANSQDPNIEIADGKEWPKELLYSHRMADMIARYAPEADDEMKLSVHSQHIMRWTSPRADYPMNRAGYFKWRTDLYKYHANTAGEFMAEAGYGEESIERVKKAVGKRGLKINPDTQMLEDVVDLVFIEYYMVPMVEKFSDYTEEKWIDIIQKTWRKMSERAHEFALSGAIKLPEHLVPLIQKSIASL